VTAHGGQSARMPKQIEVQEAIDRLIGIRWDLFCATIESECEPSPLRCRLILAECLEWLAIAGIQVRIVPRCVYLLSSEDKTMSSAVAKIDATPVAVLVLQAFRKLIAYALKYGDAVEKAKEGSFFGDLRRIYEYWRKTQDFYQKKSPE